MSTFKKTKVVMLPTNEKAVIGFLTQKGKERGNLVHFDSPMPNILDSENQHLYFLSDEKIKEVDWYIHNQKGTGSRVQKCIGTNLPMDAKKIIATTDRLNMHPNIADSYRSGNCLPQPSQSFIEKFVEEYNKGNIITEVLVEYEDYDWGLTVRDNFVTYQRLKINPKDNTITIKKVKGSWSREEVIELLHRRMEYTFGEDYDKSTTDKWIEENL